MKIINYIKGSIYIYRAIKSYTIGRLTRERNEARNEAETLKRLLGKYSVWARNGYTINLLHDLELYVPAEWEPKELRDQLDGSRADSPMIQVVEGELCPGCMGMYDYMDDQMGFCSNCRYNPTYWTPFAS